MKISIFIWEKAGETLNSILGNEVIVIFFLMNLFPTCVCSPYHEQTVKL